MRLLKIVLLLVFIIGFLWFAVTNMDAMVPVKVFNTLYPDVSLNLLVFVEAVVVGLFVGIIAIAEGANLRLDNRRLRKEIQQLETEINYLRTQPSTAPRQQPDAGQPRGKATRATGADLTPPPSAPVYDTDDEGWPPDDDDDIYSGGRAV